VTTELSKTQIDKLGTRLKKGEISDLDLRMLDEYRRSFSETYEFVIGAIRTELGLETTGRPAKSTTSISDKLLRESIRLSQVQDISGCRIVVSGIADQDQVVASLARLFDNAMVVDRREDSSHGYRAVHVIVRHDGKPVEIQVRTSLQQVWAELSEKLSDVIDPALKYGRGDETLVAILLKVSAVVAREEAREAKLARVEKQVKDVSVMLSEGILSADWAQEVSDLQRKLSELQQTQMSVKEESLKIIRSIKDEVQLEEE
jgi:putative GTP pyrophosphokinase